MLWMRFGWIWLQSPPGRCPSNEYESSPLQTGKPMATNTLDRTAKQLVLTVQDYSLFAHRAVMNLFRPPRYWPEFLVQSDIIGVGSTSIVLLSGFFTGGVLALQSASTLSEFGASNLTGRFVGLTMIRELGPVLTGVMV